MLDLFQECTKTTSYETGRVKYTILDLKKTEKAWKGRKKERKKKERGSKQARKRRKKESNKDRKKGKEEKRKKKVIDNSFSNL